MELNVIIGAVCAVLGVVFSYVAFSRNRANDNRCEGEQNGIILTELGYIKANTDEIKAEQKDQRQLNNEVLTRLTSVEASAKQAHMRLDHIENVSRPRN